jgi:hypothetical protein
MAGLLSWLACVGSLAHAQPVPSAGVPGPPRQRVATTRHAIGVQVGGSAFLQAMYRFRAWGPLHLEVGGAGLPHGLPSNMTLGTTLAFFRDERWFPYVGGGVAVAGFDAINSQPCQVMNMPCDHEGRARVLRYLHVRAGLGIALGDRRCHSLAAELNVWGGQYLVRNRAATGAESRSSRSFVWPMPGVSYFFCV